MLTFQLCRPPCRASTWKIAPPLRIYNTFTITAASHDYKLPSHNYLLPPMTTCGLPRLLAAFHDYLLPTFSPSLRLLRERPKTPCPEQLLRRVTAQNAR